MFYRQILTELQDLAKKYPIVTIMGPRQSGKTTIAQTAFPSKKYVNLEYPDIRKLASEDPRRFLESLPDGGILDEIQRVPELLSYIQPICDEKDQKGMFILTGSHGLELHEAISQSLAGRTAILQLLPMSLNELEIANIQLSLDAWLLNGGYPRIYKDKLDPTKAYANYFQTYVERDLRQLIQVKDLLQFEKFVRILAGRIGQIVNLDEIGGEIGASSHTVKQWISILEASFIIFRLAPYFENFGKRLIKSPKIYFTDTGLAAYLLGIQNETQMSRDPLRGYLFENAVILELKKYRLNLGLEPNLYFYRDIQKNEVDVIFKSGSFLYPIEIKSSQTFHSDFLKTLQYFEGITKEKTPISFLIYSGAIEQTTKQTQIVNFRHTAKIFKSIEQ